MYKTVYDGVLIDYCPECRGIWLDGGEFDAILLREGEETEKLWKKAKVEMAAVQRFVPEESHCRCCIQGFVETFVKNGIEVDECDHCHGMFFDKGELDKCLDGAHPWLTRIIAHVKDLW